ncbi:hypothetical protein WA158_003244 [Blastocystis sp. Blastoise]
MFNIGYTQRYSIDLINKAKAIATTKRSIGVKRDLELPSPLYGKICFLPTSLVSKDYFYEKIIHLNSTTSYSDVQYYYQVRNPQAGLNKNETTFLTKYYTIPSNLYFTFYSLPKVDDIHDLFDLYDMVIFVKSSEKNYKIRELLRRTSLSHKMFSNFTIQIYYVIAIPQQKMMLSPNITKEQERYNDLIVENIVDTFTNVTLKDMIVEDLFVLLSKKPNYFMILDDDCCLNINKLVSSLPTLPSINLYTGTDMKFVPLYNYQTRYMSADKSIFPHAFRFIVGYTILMSRDVVTNHVNLFRQIQKISHFDDVMLGWYSLSSRTGITQFPDFSIEINMRHFKRIPIALSNYTVYHKIKQYEDMVELCNL